MSQATRDEPVGCGACEYTRGPDGHLGLCYCGHGAAHGAWEECFMLDPQEEHDPRCPLLSGGGEVGKEQDNG